MDVEHLVAVDSDGRILLPVFENVRATHYRVQQDHSGGRVILTPMALLTADSLQVDAKGYREVERKARDRYKCPLCEAVKGSPCHVKGKPDRLLEDGVLTQHHQRPTHRARVDLVVD